MRAAIVALAERIIRALVPPPPGGDGGFRVVTRVDEFGRERRTYEPRGSR